MHSQHTNSSRTTKTAKAKAIWYRNTKRHIKRGDKRGDSVKRETAWGTWDLRSHRGAVGLKAREMHSTRRTIKPVSVTSDLRDQLTAICRKAKEKEICCSDEIRDRSMRPERLS